MVTPLLSRIIATAQQIRASCEPSVFHSVLRAPAAVTCRVTGWWPPELWWRPVPACGTLHARAGKEPRRRCPIGWLKGHVRPHATSASHASHHIWRT